MLTPRARVEYRARMRSLPARLALAAALLGLACTPRTPRSPLELWFYQSTSLADSAAFARIGPLWARAAAAGYSRVVLVDARFARPLDQDSTWLARAHRLRTLADSLRLEIVPGVCLAGRAQDGLLAADPNLAEALPVRDARYVVRGGRAFLVADPPVALAARPDRVDAGVRVSPGVARVPGGATRVAWTIDVAPWRSYHVSVRLAAKEFRGEPRVRVTGDGKELAFASVAVPAADSAEWRDVVFDSQAHRRVTITFSSTRASRGALTWSSWRIEETGPIHMVRRPGMAFRFAGLAEGRDFDAVVDTLLGRGRGRARFDTWHEPPVPRVRRPDGTELRASWWQAAVLLRGQVACCLADSNVIARQRDEVQRTRELFGARTIFLMHDEIRALGQDSTCLESGLPSAQILAANVRALAGAAGDARMCVWGDLFDPLQNAVPDYYLVRGGLAGAGDALPRAIDVVNWNGARAAPSLRGFALRGHRQVWAGYYDRPPGEIQRILPILENTRGAYAVMYTTWQERWDDLEAFAREVRAR